MNSEIVVAVIAFCGTLVGTMIGIVASAKITSFRLEQLEKRVDKHNDLIERTYILSEKMENAIGRIVGLEKREV